MVDLAQHPATPKYKIKTDHNKTRIRKHSACHVTIKNVQQIFHFWVNNFLLTLGPSKINRFGEIQYYIICSPVDPLQWMGAVKMRIQTADKNTIIYTSPLH